MTLRRRLTAEYPETPVIMLTAFGSVPLAVEAMKLGAYDFVLKPWSIEELRVRRDTALIATAFFGGATILTMAVWAGRDAANANGFPGVNYDPADAVTPEHRAEGIRADDKEGVGHSEGEVGARYEQ